MKITLNTNSTTTSFKANLKMGQRIPHYTYKIIQEELSQNNSASNLGKLVDNKLSQKLVDVIHERLERIPAGQRQMFQKYFGLSGYKRLNIEEIATERNIPWKRVRMWINLALRNLREDKNFIQQIRHYRGE